MIYRFNIFTGTFDIVAITTIGILGSILESEDSFLLLLEDNVSGLELEA